MMNFKIFQITLDSHKCCNWLNLIQSFQILDNAFLNICLFHIFKATLEERNWFAIGKGTSTLFIALQFVQLVDVGLSEEIVQFKI